MGDTSVPATGEWQVSCFPSFAEMRAAHSVLLKRHREYGDTAEFLAEVEDFVRQGAATGALLDVEDERWSSQSWLDYWSTMLYRAGQEPPDSTLAEFDITLAPELPDHLCPYVGLDAFGKDNRDFFFGRGRLVKEMIGRLEENRLLAVIGSSGCGKSSLVRAGLLPRLRDGALPGSQEWRYFPPMVPGSSPLVSLARNVLPPDMHGTGLIQRHAERFQRDSGYLSQLIGELVHAPVVLVVDQFEELFTLCEDDRVHQAFVNNLLNLVQLPGARHTVILTMRTDFEGLVARLPRFHPIFEQARIRVAPMNASELREAIERPSERVGLKFEEGIVEALLGDILGEPAALPLLQFTLLKLWENRERNRVTWEVYRRLGGGRLALARSADEFYDELLPEDQVTARRILLRMVRPGEGLEVTSNRVRRQVLYQAGEARDRVDRVLLKLTQARLVRLTKGDVQADAQVEVAHEALVRNWPRLVDWLEEERVEMRRRLRLAAAAEQWQALGREPEALWRGLQLAEASRYDDLNELETEFVQASKVAEKEAHFKELQQAKELAEEQARAARRLRMALALLASLFVLAVGAAIVVIRQTQVVARQEGMVAGLEQAIARTAEVGEVTTETAQVALTEEWAGALDLAVAATVQTDRGATSVAARETELVKEATAAAAQKTTTVAAQEATAAAATETARVTATATPTTHSAETPSSTDTPTPTATPTSTPVLMPTPTPEQPEVAVCIQVAAIFAAPDTHSVELGYVKEDGLVAVLGRSAVGNWLYVRNAAGLEGFVYQPYFDWPGDFAALPIRRVVVPVTPVTPVAERSFELIYQGCRPHGLTLGSVKGQVFDAEGEVIPGAQVEIWIDGRPWDSPANPASTNQDGWYEWVLGTDQIVRFVTLYVDGQQMPFVPAADPFEVQSRAGCFQHVDFRETTEQVQAQ